MSKNMASQGGENWCVRGWGKSLKIITIKCIDGIYNSEKIPPEFLKWRFSGSKNLFFLGKHVPSPLPPTLMCTKQH